MKSKNAVTGITNPPDEHSNANRSERARQHSFIASAMTFPVLIVCLPIVLVLSVGIGVTNIPLDVIVKILLNGSRLFHITPHWDSTLETIIWQLRMPTALAGALVGAALAVAGALFQGLLRNPLADPFLIGTSSGAALGATIAYILPVGAILFFPITPLLAFAGALFTVMLVYGLARTGNQVPVVTLLLAGVVVNSVLIAFQTMILTLWPPAPGIGFMSLFNWLSGSISTVSWGALLVVSGIILVGLVLAQGLAGILDVFALGEERAAHLGIHIERSKFFIVILASLLTAAAVSISGLIGFVGLVTPHLMRLLLGPRHVLLIPASALTGAIFLVLADLGARVILGSTTLPVGVFTAFIGAPFFLWLLRTRKQEYRW